MGQRHVSPLDKVLQILQVASQPAASCSGQSLPEGLVVDKGNRYQRKKNQKGKSFSFLAKSEGSPFSWSLSPIWSKGKKLQFQSATNFRFPGNTCRPLTRMSPSPVVSDSEKNHPNTAHVESIFLFLYKTMKIWKVLELTIPLAAGENDSLYCLLFGVLFKSHHSSHSASQFIKPFYN